MKIVLKPLGVLVLLAGMGTLTFLAVRQQKASPANAATTTSAPTALASKPIVSSGAGIIYDDELKNGWANFSWAKNDLMDSSVVSTGHCIRVEPKKFEAVYFHHAPMDLKAYDRLTFRIHGGDTGGQLLKLMAQFETDGKNTGGSEYVLPQLAAKKWDTVTVPLAKLGAADKPNVAGFWIQEATGQTLKPFYVDDVRLLQPGEAVPSG